MPLPASIGPVFLCQHGGLVAVRAPRDPAIEAALRRVRATWDPGTRQWWVTAGRIGRLVVELQAVVDPLFSSHDAR